MGLTALEVVAIVLLIVAGFLVEEAWQGRDNPKVLIGAGLGIACLMLVSGTLIAISVQGP